MAHETNENIVNYILETYERMAAAATASRKKNISAKELWEQTTFLSTDAASKNLRIGEGVARALGSNHVPIHLLCKSHTVEGLEASHLNVLSKCLEIPLKLRSEFENMNPALRSFFRNMTVVQAGMKSILKLVTPDKNANSCSLASSFDNLCIQNNSYKKLTLYQERRFCKLGSCANAILQSLPILKQLLSETPADNLLAQACRLYIKCEVFLTELWLLAYFSYHITFPFLNCVEVCDTPTLKSILPKLFQDLMADDVSTLKDYVIKSKRGNIDTLNSELETKLVHLLCADAATCIQRQCGREFGFPAPGE